MNTKKILSGAAALALVAGLATVGTAFADTPANPGQPWGGQGNQQFRMGGAPGGMRQGMRPAVFGTVSAINGDSITLAGRQGFGTSSAAVSYTVDATNATVMKNNATSSVSAVAVGDTLVVQGTVSGTSVTATMIRDGQMMARPGGQGFGGRNASSTRPAGVMIQGNGEPVVEGAVASVSGVTLTITNKSNITYTVDTTNATIVKGNATSSIGNITIGDDVIVQGTVNGTSVTASSVIDQPARPAQQQAPKSLPEKVKGFFGSIGGFFSHMFGF